MNRRGFTLIEILVVLTIIALLLGLVATRVGDFLGRGEEAKAENQIQQLKLLLEQYRNGNAGDYPPSRLAEFGLKSRNAINEGNEALVVAFFHKDHAGGGQDAMEGWLKDLEGDAADKNVTRKDNALLQELVDPWDNPIVYLRRDDYEKEHAYEFVDPSTGLAQVVTVRAEKNPNTGGFYAMESFQLRSAGPDGQLDTDDDIRSYGG